MPLEDFMDILRKEDGFEGFHPNPKMGHKMPLGTDWEKLERDYEAEKAREEKDNNEDH